MIPYDILKIKSALAKPVHYITEYIICSLVRFAIIWIITQKGFSAFVDRESFKCYMR